MNCCVTTCRQVVSRTAILRELQRPTESVHVSRFSRFRLKDFLYLRSGWLNSHSLLYMAWWCWQRGLDYWLPWERSHILSHRRGHHHSVMFSRRAIFRGFLDILFFLLFSWHNEYLFKIRYNSLTAQKVSCILRAVLLFEFLFVFCWDCQKCWFNTKVISGTVVCFSPAQGWPVTVSTEPAHCMLPDICFYYVSVCPCWLL